MAQCLHFDSNDERAHPSTAFRSSGDRKGEGLKFPRSAGRLTSPFFRESWALIGIRIPGPIDSDVVIREYEQPGGTTYFNFLHVATGASGFSNRAGLSIAVLASD